MAFIQCFGYFQISPSAQPSAMLQGPMGMPGFSGYPGPPGQKGSRGQAGRKGKPGETGAAGPRGQMGDRGSPGLSAFFSDSYRTEPFVRLITIYQLKLTVIYFAEHTLTNI